MTSRSGPLRALAIPILAAGLGSPLLAVTLTVTNTNDSGPGSLRQAIFDANGISGADEIDFTIPGGGVQTIQLALPLPAITEPAYIDGYTQPGASPNSNPTGQGFNTVLKIEIRGPGSVNSPCFTVAAENTDAIEMVIQGLAINRCSRAIVVPSGGDSAVIRQNFIGTDASGAHVQATINGGILVQEASGVRIAANLVSPTSTAGIELNDAPDSLVLGNLVGTNAAGDSFVYGDNTGIEVFNCPNAMIGGTTPDARNVVSGSRYAIEDSGDVAQGNQIVGNFVGTDVTGTKALGNGQIGIRVSGPHIVTGNVVAASGEGIVVDAPHALLQGNFVGTDVTATLDLGNRYGGITVVLTGNTVIGGTGPGEGNVVAHNGSGDPITGGIFVRGPFVTIRGNRIFDNRPLGIHFNTGSGGVTPNDPGDVDVGMDNLTLQNYPVITSVVPGATTTHIVGSLNSQPGFTYDVDLYASSACPLHPHDYLQGETYLGPLQVTTDAFGNAAFAVDVPFVLAAGQPVTATATDPLGNTSEFSQRIVFSVDPPSGLAAGGTTATVHGMAFEPGATVSVGGIPATNVAAVDPATLTAAMPGLAPGTLHPLTVAVPSGLVNTLPNGWLADFLDVPTTNDFHDYVARLVVNGVAVGVGGGNYGVDQATLREQMAVFLLKGKHGACYAPPPCAGIFGDVDCPSTYADWIEELSAEGITAGCGNGDYCPEREVRREEMAVFLLKAQQGAAYAPPSCTGIFGDVACPSTYADWIEQLAANQITAGCGNGNYCPEADTARGQMAVFVVKTFFLP